MDEKNSTIYDNVDLKSKELGNRVRGFLMRNFPYVMLAVNIVFEILSRLFVIGFATPFTPSFWSNLFLNTCSSTIAYACFMVYAERTKKLNSTEYKGNLKIWSEKSASVRFNSFDCFIAYCKEQYERECEERQIEIIANNTHLSIEKWKKEYKMLSDKDLRKKLKEGEISKAELKYIRRANRKPRLKPIDPLLILAGLKANDINDAGRRTSSSMRSVAIRPVGFILISVIVSMFAGRFIGFEDSSAFFDMLYTAGLIIGSSLVGYAKGVSNAEKRHNEIKGRIIFLECYARHQEETLPN